MHYRRDIDGLRAIAVLAVVFGHFFPHSVTGGFIGVDVFFVISGYLITQVLSERLGTGNFSLIDFYQRRILRIFPAFILMLVACWSMGWFFLLSKEYSELSSAIKSSAFFFQNFSLYKASGYFTAPSELNPLLHIWSLSVEEQFYLLYPLLLALAWTRRIVVILAVLALSYIWNVYVTYANPPSAFYLPWGRAWELLIGAGMYLLTTRTPGDSGAGREKKWDGALSIFGLLGITAAVFLFDRTVRFPGFFALLPVLSAACILIAKNSFINQRILSNRVLVGIGLISYPLYLWHWPALVFTRTISGAEPSLWVKLGLILLSALLAALTYRLIEVPIRFGQADNRKLHSVKATALLFLMLAIGGLGIGSERLEGFPERKVMIEAQQMMTEMNHSEKKLRQLYPDGDCSELPEKLTRAVDCMSYGKLSAAKKTIVIWGDSHAGSWRTVLYAIAKQHGLRVLVFRHPGCAPLLGTRRRHWESTVLPRACEEFGLAEDVVRVIRAIKPEHIFISARWSLYASNPPFFLTTDTNPNEEKATLDTAKSALETKIPLTIRTLRSISPVTVLFEMPQLKLPVDSPAGSGIARARDLFEPEAGRHLLQERITRETFHLESRVKQDGLQSIDLFDPAELTCFDGVCHAILNATVLYLDDNHVSPAGSLLFQQMFLRHF